MLLTALKVKLAAMVAVAGLDTAQIDKLGDATKGALETLEVQQKDDKIDKQKAFTDAITAIKEAADKGDPSAAYVLAHWMTFGILQGAPAEQVLGLYKKAADAGQLQAMSELGALTLRGAQDQAKADEGIALIKAASDKGELGAMRAYAQILLRGTERL
jgi:TPR repeat protein